MSKTFDATTKYLVETRPADWLAYLGLAVAEVEIVDADLSTVLAEADTALWVKAANPYLAHLEFQSGYDAEMGERLLRYNVLLRGLRRAPVRSVVVLLRPEADGPAMSGRVEHRFPEGDRYLEFVYQIVRVWQQPVEEILAGGLGTLPLAPLANVTEDSLPGIIGRMEARIDKETATSDGATLWTATYLLMGLRYPREFATQLLQGVRAMKESTTYQAILEEGEARGEVRGEARGMEKGKTEEARALLLRLGSKRFGPPDAATQAAITVTAEIERLELLIDRILDVESWAELMQA